MRLKPDGQDLGLDLRKRGDGVATPKIEFRDMIARLTVSHHPLGAEVSSAYS